MKLRLSLGLFFTVCVSLYAQNTPQSLADGELPALLTIYKDLHIHPELSTHEARTAALVAKELLGEEQVLLAPFRFGRYQTGELHPVSNSPFPWS